MKRLKEQILDDNQPPTFSTSPPKRDPTSSTSPPAYDPTSSTCYPTPSTSSHATRSNDTYVYGIDVLAAFANGACVFFAYNTFQPKNKKPVNEKQDQPPKRRHML